MRLRIREFEDLEEGDIVGGVLLEPDSVMEPQVEVYKKARTVLNHFEHKYVPPLRTVQWAEEGGVPELSEPMSPHTEFLVIQP